MVKKMKRSILAVCIAVVVIALVVAPVAARVTAPTNIKDALLKGIWNALLDLQKQIDDLALKIKAIPKGDTGPPGPPGPAGANGKDGAQGLPGDVPHFGAGHWVDLDTCYYADTDGFVVASVYFDKNTDESVPSVLTLEGIRYNEGCKIGHSGVTSSILHVAGTPEGYTLSTSITLPVEKGSSYRVSEVCSNCENVYKYTIAYWMTLSS